MPAIASIPVFFITILFDDKLYSNTQKWKRNQEASGAPHDSMKEVYF
jgi:hypothetical protein